MTDTPCLDALDRLLLRLRREAANAARRNKPTMWAYYGRMEERLLAWFATQADAARGARGNFNMRELRAIDGGIAGAALALLQRSIDECPNLPRDEAADLWALGTYASSILRAWGAGRAPRPSLAWMRRRIAATAGGESS